MEIRRFPNKLKMFRYCQGYSQKKVARLLGFSDTSTLSRWERGYSVPGLIQLLQLARIYHVEPQELFEQLRQTIDTDLNLLAHEEPFSSNQPLNP
jgi:transcriptional regulator with XRE-family HTH domain